MCVLCDGRTDTIASDDADDDLIQRFVVYKVCSGLHVLDAGQLLGYNGFKLFFVIHWYHFPVKRSDRDLLSFVLLINVFTLTLSVMRNFIYVSAYYYSPLI